MRRVAGFVAILAAGSLFALGRSIVTADEAWFLQVVHRVTTGDVLYRDVFFGATPLSVQVVAALASFIGAEVWLVRATMVVCLAATALVSSQIVRQLGSPREFSWLLAVALLLLGFPVPCAPYAPLATLFLLVALVAVLRWEASVRGSWQELALAGAACGASFALKQNIGLYALAATLASVCSGRPGGVSGLPRALAVLATSFAAAAALPLLPTWWSGALPAFAEYAFLGKGTYVRFARVTYLEGLRSASSHVARAAYFLAPLAWAGLAATWRTTRGPERRRIVILAAFCAAATLGLFPLAEEVHLAYMMPVFLVTLAFACGRLGLGRSGPGRLAHAGAGIALLALLALRTAEPLLGLAAGTARLSSLRHFQGVVMPKAAHWRVRARATRLRQEGNQGTFILSSQAGFFYLVSGLRNPTPFDYPLVMAFGRQGEAQTVAAIRSGAVSSVCVDGDVLRTPLRPPLLAAFVQDEMAPGGDTGFCALYRQPS